MEHFDNSLLKFILEPHGSLFLYALFSHGIQDLTQCESQLNYQKTIVLIKKDQSQDFVEST